MGSSRIMAPMQVEFKKPTMTMLFRGAAIRRMTIVTPFIFFFCSLTYFGLVLNQDLFNYGLFFSGVVELLAGAVVLLMGVKNNVKMVVITNAVSGLCCLIAAGLTKSVYLDIVCMAARFFGGMTNCCAQTILAVMYPTLFRTMALGWGNFFTNLALAVAANIVLLSGKAGHGALGPVNVKQEEVGKSLPLSRIQTILTAQKLIESELSAYLPLIILGLSGLLGSFFLLFLPGKVCRDLLDLPEEVEYGHENITEQRLKDPDAKLIEPKWTPPTPVVENTTREPSFARAPSEDQSRTKADKRLESESDNIVGIGEVGQVEPDGILPKGKIIRLSQVKKKPIFGDFGSRSQKTNSLTIKKKRRWYFLFIC